nr:VapC toxin family PIN domain ribonuclease [Pseudoclavibacter chungangensis]
MSPQTETEPLLVRLDQTTAGLVTSDLLETELRRMAVSEGRDQAKVSTTLDGVSLAALGRATRRSEGFLPIPFVQTLEVLPLEAAIRLEVDAVLTYERRLGRAARELGLDVIAPGVSDDGLARQGGE